MKEVLLDYYIDGFNVEQINCWDLSIAGACGCYEKELYFYYVFLYVIHDNWIGKIDRKNILQQIGLISYEHQVVSEKELLSNIFIAIDLKKPILLPIRYNRIFFDSKYDRNNRSIHFLLITGYDKENGLIKIRDYLYARNLVQAILNKKVDVFADLTITTKQLCDIYFEPEVEKKHAILTIESLGSPSITSYNELIRYYLKEVQITKENCYDNVDFHSMSLEKIRRQLYRSVIMFENVLERAFSDEHCVFKDKKRTEFKKRMEAILNERNIITNTTIKTIIKGNAIDNKLLNIITESDKKIYNLIYDTYQQVEFKEIGRSCNLALNAAVIFDSEGKNAPAVNAVNGKIISDGDCWLSTYKYKEHWLVVDLGEVHQVGKFVVKHHPVKKTLVTCDFKIEGSNDLQIWDELVRIENNREHESQINIPIVSYRYFRLYIEKANHIDENSARIFSFEIY